jgi:hypothetical protein
MPIQDSASQLIEQLVNTRAKAHFDAFQKAKAHSAAQKKRAEAHEKRQLELIHSTGIKPGLLVQEQRNDAKELKEFLETARGPLIARPDSRVLDAKNRAGLALQFADGAKMVPPYGVVAPLDPPVTPNGITHGWVFTDAAPLKIEAHESGSGTGWGATGGPFPTPHDVLFTFVPAVSTTYEMTAIFAFHGFLVLRADDGWLTHKVAQVDLNVELIANQYFDLPTKTFNPIHRDESNINEVDSYDQTLFLDFTAPLRAGDPVVVTARFTVEAVAAGSGSYAEINFADGTANFIQPLFLSVTTV